MTDEYPRRILCPIDFSDCSRRALAEATRLANEHDARLFVIHVDMAGSSIPPGHRGYVSELDMHKRLIEEAKPIVREGKTEMHYLRGQAIDEIRRFVELRNIDLIVMGTHGRTGLAKMVMGSVAEQLSKDAACKVNLVSPDDSWVSTAV
jgi:universal stress protein A